MYQSGDNITPGSWRILKQGPTADSAMVIEHFEILIEEDIDLSDTKKTDIEAGIGPGSPYSDDTPYYASVLIDTRVDPSSDEGIETDMTGNTVFWNHYRWQFSTTGWFFKGDYKNSTFTDRLLTDRINLFRPDPNSQTRYTPRPDVGIAMGSRRRNGFEHISWYNSRDRFGMVPLMNHDPNRLLFAPDQLFALLGPDRVDTLPVSWSYVMSYIPFFLVDYNLGDRVVYQDTMYRCNTAGPQEGPFDAERDKWTHVLDITDFDRIMTDRSGQAGTGRDGHVGWSHERFKIINDALGVPSQAHIHGDINHPHEPVFPDP